MAYALFRPVSWAIQCNIQVSWTAGHSTAQGADAAGNATAEVLRRLDRGNTGHTKHVAVYERLKAYLMA